MKQDVPDITILMSTYNRRQYLPFVLKDLQEQTFSNWKLIVVNDGGEDVKDIIDELDDPRIVYYSRQHEGKAAQLNFALDLVESKYIGYLDDDDRMLPEHFGKLFVAAEENQSDFVYSDAQPILRDSTNNSVIGEWPVNEKDIEWEDIRIHNAINHSTILHTKALAERVGRYDERMKVLIDFDYIKRMARLVKPYHVHAVTYMWNIRQDDKGKIQSISGRWNRDPVSAGKSLIAFFEKDPASLSICYIEHDRLKEIKQLEAEVQSARVQNIRLKEQLDAKLEEIAHLQAVSESKGKKHLRAIRALLWLSIALTLLLIILILNQNC